MSRKMLKRLPILMLFVTPILSGCQSTRYRPPSLSWLPWRDKGLAYSAPSGMPQPADASAGGSTSQVAANTAGGSPVNATGSPASDPYAAGADQTIAELARASSGVESSGPGYASGRQSSCSSGCCSR